ncbi:tRNA (adenosine(37)-N6)-threonylcarbamoyltransferase complex dimerization subunit type 1 TsaB [Bacillus sp. FJAT-42376]|uniref:tRNA (adenosine(37)-N6)-threonylcarbamoyltransferase complex dimerization subunit type 1 TsaB n=1 Tax=Bacillus sp. FJAT-42376 TaxID=2014076 RepID=UPI000F50E000|nr:tRNA (adenosine(37)-N6)-threonylcarbamoyltransferase complex dimerization subunit type 1 TsaB [Bacillus sp. FJAT-42376]AZB41395.1 tRNA (adenosine(37)-N6)-threonylcarbamoyltransferase complex dimerization subunit type 1 TsaB [Bacillus sp. FJAT-42376]
MKKALAIDTSNDTLGIALLSDGVVSGEIITHLKKNHSIRAMPAVEQLLKECAVTPADLTAIIAASGPGSYTGVRIGMTIAKTLAWSLSIPLFTVSSLESLAANGKYFNGLICPLFDARRGRVYTGLYSEKEGRLACHADDQNILLADWLETLKEKDTKVLFLGHDVKIHWDEIERTLGSLAVRADEVQNSPRPSELARIGLLKNQSPVHSAVPNYTRLAEAESKWLEEQK